jgi:hypothetical protein
MRKIALLMILGVVCLGLPGRSEEVSENINVLPVFKTDDGFQYIDEFDYLRGDLTGNRQGEPSCAASTINPDHILCAFNDFRLVDIGDDPPIPGTVASLFQEKLWQLARFFGLPAPVRSQPTRVARQEAGIGLTASYDHALTWVGGLVPGQFLEDTTPASLASPGLGTEGGSDPILKAAPCGKFYLIWLQFTRDDISRMMAGFIQDNNDSDTEHTFKWIRTTKMVERNNASFGPFVDKPEASIELTGESDCSKVTERLNVTWSEFTGKGNISNFQNKLYFAQSVDEAQSFEITKVDDSYTDTSGTATVVDPVTNTPYVFFRSFNPPTIVMTKKSGRKWSKPVDLLEGLPMVPFDNPTRSIFDQPVGPSMKDEIAPRANGFPTTAVTPDGSTLFVAWHERVALDGTPDPDQGPKVVTIYSRDGGDTWSDRQVVAPTHPASPPGLGFFNPGMPLGPQIQPRMSCTGGNPNQCLVIYFESRPYTAPWSNPTPGSGWNPATGLSADGYLGGYDRALDVRGVLIDAYPDSDSEPDPVVFHPSFQISRYAYRPLLDGETPDESDPDSAASFLDQICPPGVSPPDPACRLALNNSGIPHTGGGGSPFLHDYLSNEALITYVQDSESDPWRVASKPEDTPHGAAFITAFPDNRNVVQPFEDPAGGEVAPEDAWQSYSFYTPAGFELNPDGTPVFGSCLNPGSRDQNVMFAEISLGLRVTAPTNFKPFVEPVIEFPMTVWNNTGQERQFELTIEDNPEADMQASFAKEPGGDPIPYDFPLLEGAVKILPYSSSSINVYAFGDEPVTVSVVECDWDDCDGVEQPAYPLTGSITFNAPAYAPPSGSPSLTYQSSAIAVNPVPKNPVPKNPVPKNPVPKNPVPKNTIIYDVIDYSWTVTTASSDDVGTYLTLPNVDKAFQDDYIFQVFVTKPSTLRQVSGACDPTNLSLGTLIGHVSDPSNPVPKNPVPKNPVPKNPVPKNATLADTLVQNTTFTLASDTTETAGAQVASLASLEGEGCDAETGGGRFGECILFAPRLPNQVTITIRAHQVVENPSRVWNPYGDIEGEPQTLPSVIVADYWCTGADDPSECPFDQDGPELVPDTDSAQVEPTTVQAGQTVTFPTVSVRYENVGTQPAQEHRIGYYISAAGLVENLPRNSDGTIDISGPETALLQTVAAGPILTGADNYVTFEELTIPVDIPRPDNGEGTYYVWAYIDDLRVVSEVNEDDNFIRGGPITVQAPGYSGIFGLFTPCDGLTCSKNAGPALPLAFQLRQGAEPVDSEDTPPRLTIFAPTAEGACETDIEPPTQPLFVAEPADVASGSSGWQYFDASCVPEGPNSCSRDAFTHQYNFQTKYPDTGEPLEPGCYTTVVEVPATDQVIGSLLGEVVRLEITLN